MSRAAHRAPLILCLLSAAALAAPNDPWLRIQSANFELFTTAGERSGRDLLRHFEQVRSFFLQAFGLKSTNGKPVRIIAFRSEKEFQPYRPTEAATAFHHTGTDHDYIVMSSVDAGHYEIPTHEYTHVLIAQMSGVVPIWLNEGLADLYSTIQQVGPKVLVGVPPLDRERSLRAEPWIDLADILATTANSPLYNERARASMFYAESWALVHMLNLDREYRQHLAAMLDALRTVDSAEALRLSYGKSVAEVEADLQSYLRRESLRGLALPLTLPKEVETPQIETHAALPARLALAELEAGNPAKLAGTAAAYTQLAHDFPQRWEVQAAWGRFAWRERRNAEAATHFARAEELGAAEPGLFLDYARALTVTNHVDSAIGALRHAIRLDAASKEAHYELGLLLVRTSAWREATTELQLALPLKPQWASHFFFNMAYAQFRLGDLVAARNYLEQGRTYTKIPEELAALEQLSKTLGPPVVEGVLHGIDCRGTVASLRVRAGDRERTFLIADMTQAKDLECGPQKDIPVRIEFQAMPLGAAGADGIVKSLTFRE